MNEVTPLQERIAKTICNTPDRGDEWRDDWSEIPEYDRDFWMDAAAAVLPIIAAEVRKGRAAALREAAGDIVWSAETLPHMTPHDAARGLVRRAERIEKED